MSTSITMNLTEKVESSRTHERGIDVNFWEGGGLEGSKIRVFLSDTLAMELAQKIIRALATPLRPAEPVADPEKIATLWQEAANV